MGSGFGLVGLAHLLNRSACASSPFDVKVPHSPAKAKQVIYLFLNGGPSQVDTFDPKPMLDQYHGKPVPNGNLQTERPGIFSVALFNSIVLAKVGLK